MARIRTIKPEFWTHPVMGRIDDSSKCLAIALLNFADDEGYFLADPNLVRSCCRPFDDDSTIIRRCLDILCEAGWIEVKNHPSHGQIGLIVNFTEHQKIDRPKSSSISNYFIDESSTIDRRLITVGKERKGKERKGTRKTKQQALEPYPEEVRRVVNTLLPIWRTEDPEDHRPIRSSSADAGKAVDRILRENPNVTDEHLIAAGKGYVGSQRSRYKALQYYFGPEGPWDGHVRAILTREASHAS